MQARLDVVSVEATTGRILAIAQNTQFSEDADVAADPELHVARATPATRTYGAPSGFNAGSTFKLFTLVDWLEKGHSVNETLNGQVARIKRMTNSLRRATGSTPRAHASATSAAAAATSARRCSSPRSR